MSEINLPSSPNSIQFCKIENCFLPIRNKSHSLCNRHYLKFYRHGNAEIVLRASKSEPRFCVVKDCNEKHYSKTFCQLHYSRNYFHGNPLTLLINSGTGKTIQERFWSKVEKTETCWLWLGQTDKDGYGQTKLNNQTTKAHRVSWFYSFGELPKKSLLHSCDNRACVNPSHLREGTNLENSADMVSRNRQAKGEKHGMSKLKDSDILEIKKLLANGSSLRKIAKLFAVGRTTIFDIKSGKTHVSIPRQNSESDMQTSQKI